MEGVVRGAPERVGVSRDRAGAAPGASKDDVDVAELQVRSFEVSGKSRQVREDQGVGCETPKALAKIWVLLAEATILMP
jgi:hypothetical protein